MNMFEPVACYVCDSADATAFLAAEDDLTGRPGTFTIVRCASCGLAYQSPRLTLAHIKPYYDDNYIAHQPRARWGALGPIVIWAMGAVDRAKLRIVRRYVDLARSSSVLDVGCGTGTFLALVRTETDAAVAGVDFVDLSARETMRGIEFHHGVFYEQEVGDHRFDLITMWHFLEHDYDPLRSLRHARRSLAPGGRIIIEVPRLDSLSFRLFGRRWPGVQAPQHTALYDKRSLVALAERAGLEVVAHLPYGAFPPYFYLFCGAAFTARKGRGLNLQRAVLPYFAGQLLCAPVLPVLKHMNFAMQTVVCKANRRIA